MKFMYARVIEDDFSGNRRIGNSYDYGDNIIIMRRDVNAGEPYFDCINKDGVTQILGLGNFELTPKS